MLEGDAWVGLSNAGSGRFRALDNGRYSAKGIHVVSFEKSPYIALAALTLELASLSPSNIFI